MIKVAGVRFKNAGKVYYFDPDGLDVVLGDSVIVETARGMEFGTVTMEITEIKEEDVVQPLKKIVRKANPDDMLRSASGSIKTKVDENYGGILSEADRYDLAALIYNPQAEINRRKKSEPDFDKWCTTVIYRLVTICRSVSTKYTRSKVRRRLPKYLDYAMDELLHVLLGQRRRITADGGLRRRR